MFSPEERERMYQTAVRQQAIARQLVAVLQRVACQREIEQQAAAKAA